MLSTALQRVDLIDREEFVLVFFDAEKRAILSVSRSMDERLARLTLQKLGKDDAEVDKIVRNSRAYELYSPV